MSAREDFNTSRILVAVYACGATATESRIVMTAWAVLGAVSFLQMVIAVVRMHREAQP